MKPKTLIVLRAHLFDAQLRRTFDRLSALGICDVCLVIDETGGLCGETGPGIISLNFGALSRLRLAVPEHVGWVCGDYAIFVAMEALGDYDFYWLIEYDVYFNFTDLSDFFRFFDTDVTSDFIAPRLGPASMDWVWSKTIMPFEDIIHGCLFGAVRLSRRAAVCALEARRKLADSHPNLALFEFPNDEVFCASTLHCSGLVCRDLNAFGRNFYSSDTLGLCRVFPLQYLNRKSNDDCLYHPALSGESLLERYLDIIARGDADLFDFVCRMADHVAFDLDERQNDALRRALSKWLAPLSDATST